MIFIYAMTPLCSYCVSWTVIIELSNLSLILNKTSVNVKVCHAKNGPPEAECPKQESSEDPARVITKIVLHYA